MLLSVLKTPFDSHCDSRLTIANSMSPQGSRDCIAMQYKSKKITYPTTPIILRVVRVLVENEVEGRSYV